MIDLNVKKDLTGIFPPMMTPFNQDQTVDLGAVKSNVERYNQTDIGGLMPLGSNGEYAYLSDDESCAVIKAVKETLADGKTLMVGTGRESAYHTVEFIKKVVDLGAQYVSILTPHYYKGKMTDDALYRYYTYIADHSSVPVLIYNAPKFAYDICTSASLIKQLADHPNIVGMKDTSSEDISIYTDATKGKNFFVLAGSISKYLYGLQCGGIGGVLSAANFLPQECSEILPLYEQGKLEQANELSEKLKALTTACSGKTGIPGSKACMTLMGFVGGYPRLPLLPLTQSQLEQAKTVLSDAGYLK